MGITATFMPGHGALSAAPRRAGAPLLFLIAMIAATFAPTIASGQSREKDRLYDIPAQDLETALLAFSRLSGVDIVYDRAVLSGLRSAPLKGRFATPLAVATLLGGSGLSHRFTSATAVLILRGGGRSGTAEEPGAERQSGAARLVLDRLHVTAGRIIGRPPADYRAFGQVIQSTIMRRLQDNPATQLKRLRARLSVQIDAQGVIRQLAVEDSTGDAAADAEIVRSLLGMTLPEPPPEDMPQPVWFEVVQR